MSERDSVMPMAWPPMLKLPDAVPVTYEYWRLRLVPPVASSTHAEPLRSLP